MIKVRVYQKGRDTVIAVCDAELFGKKFVENNKILDVNEFYNGMEIDESILKDYLSIATIANLVGERTISLAVNLGFIKKENIIYVKGIPHAQLFIM